jgi:hypothetical protein
MRCRVPDDVANDREKRFSAFLAGDVAKRRRRRNLAIAGA